MLYLYTVPIYYHGEIPCVASVSVGLSAHWKWFNFLSTQRWKGSEKNEMRLSNVCLHKGLSTPGKPREKRLLRRLMEELISWLQRTFLLVLFYCSYQNSFGFFFLFKSCYPRGVGGGGLNRAFTVFLLFSRPYSFKQPVSPKVLCGPRYIFRIWKIRHFLDCREVWFVPSSIAAVSDPKALVWILTWHLSAAVSISLYISEVFSRWRRRSLNWMPRRVQESWGEGRVFWALPKLCCWRSPCIISGGKEKHLRVSAIALTLCLPK